MQIYPEKKERNRQANQNLKKWEKKCICKTEIRFIQKEKKDTIFEIQNIRTEMIKIENVEHKVEEILEKVG